MWNKIELNIQNIKHETGKATLFMIPKNCNYGGWLFWIPSKLVRSGSHSYACRISFTNDFSFKLQKKSVKGNVTDEKVIDGAEMLKILNNFNTTNQESFLNVSEPEKLEIEQVEVKQCLQNNR